jgi:hypothetical protein
MASQVDEKALAAWLSLMAGTVVAYRRNLNSKALAHHMQGQLSAAIQVIKLVGGKEASAQFKKIITMIGANKARGKNGMPTTAYAELMYAAKISMGRFPKPKALKTFLESTSVPEPEGKLANLILGMFTPTAERVDAKEKALDTKLAILPDTFIKSMFCPEKIPDQQQHVEELKHIIKQVTGKPGLVLTPEQRVALKEKKPNVHKRLVQVEGNITNSWKTYVRMLVRKNPAGAGKPMKIDLVLQALAKAHIDAPALKSFGRLFVGEDCRLYTSAGKRINVMPMPGSAIYWRVKGTVLPSGHVVGESYDPKKDNGIIFWYRVPGSVAKDEGKAYTEGKLQANKGNKDAKIEHARHVVPPMRDKWIALLNSKDRFQQTVGAMMEILYTYACRAGNPGNSTKGEDTFGLTTLQVNQIKPRSGGYLLTYPGKDHKLQAHQISPTNNIAKRVIAVIHRVVSGRKGDEYAWVVNGKRISNGVINVWFKKLHIPITAHNLRNIRGSNMMEKLIKDANIPKTASRADMSKIIKGLAINVGGLLGHVSGDKTTGSTAITSYILPHIMAAPFRKRKLKVPGWVPRGGGDVYPSGPGGVPSHTMPEPEMDKQPMPVQVAPLKPAAKPAQKPTAKAPGIGHNRGPSMQPLPKHVKPAAKAPPKAAPKPVKPGSPPPKWVHTPGKYDQW